MSMQRLIVLSTALFGAAVLMVGCGGGGNKAAQQSTGAPAAAASPAAVASPAIVPAAAGSATVAPVPAKLNCGTMSPVWANTRTHVYHTASDPLYGRTRHGQYMCPQQAASAGYHPAGGTHARKGHHKAASPGAMAQPSPSP